MYWFQLCTQVPLASASRTEVSWALSDYREALNASVKVNISWNREIVQVTCSSLDEESVKISCNVTSEEVRCVLLFDLDCRSEKLVKWSRVLA